MDEGTIWKATANLKSGISCGPEGVYVGLLKLSKS